MGSVSMNIDVETDLGALARLAFVLVVLGHVSVFLHVFVFPWLPAVLVVICYPLLVNRIGHGIGSVECGKCGAEQVPGSFVCRDCRTWLGNDGRRSLIRGALGAPALAIAFEAALALTAAGLYSTSLRESAAVAFAVVYPQSSVFFAFSAGLVYVVAGCSYLVVHALAGTVRRKWSMASIR